MLLQGSLSIERMCQLVPVSRRSFYRSLKEKRPVEEETEVRSIIQQIALEHRRRYGYRRMTAELRRRGMQVNHKRVVRIMREDNLLALQPKCFQVTTNSNHKLEIYLNLAAWNICGRTSKSSSRSITIGSGYSSERPKTRPNFEAQRSRFL